MTEESRQSLAMNTMLLILLALAVVYLLGGFA